MNNTYDRVQIKEAAKAALRRSAPRSWKVTLLYWLLMAVGPGLIYLLAGIPTVMSLVGTFTKLSMLGNINYGYYSPRPEAMVGQAIGSVLGALVPLMLAGVAVAIYQLVMEYGYAGWALKSYTGEGNSYSDLFGGFKVIGRAIGASIMVSIFTWLWSQLVIIPATILYVIFIVVAVLSQEVAVAIAMGFLCLLVMVGAVIGSICISYRYVLTPYYIMSDRNIGVFDAITAGKLAMRGNIGRRFVLDLSFIGWGILVGLIGGAVSSIISLVTGGASLVQIFTGIQRIGDHPEMLLRILGPAIIGMILAPILGKLASLALDLWVTAYQANANAGFFVVVSGYGKKAEQQPPQQPPMGGGYTQPQIPQPPQGQSPMGYPPQQGGYPPQVGYPQPGYPQQGGYVPPAPPQPPQPPRPPQPPVPPQPPAWNG